MTTPTPYGSKRPLNAAQSTATPPAQPLFGQFTSPAPRSMPSPAAHRAGQQAGKSPFAASHAPSVGSTTTTAGALNHPTGSSGKGTGGLLGSSPAPLGMDSPAGLGLGGLGALAGVDMGLTASQMGSLGLGVSSGGVSQGAGSSGGGGGRARVVDDEERRKRLEAVIALVGRAPGRVSDEGIERLAKRYGLDVECTPPMGQSRPDGTRQISLAGETFIIDVGSKGDAIQSIVWEGAENAFSETAAALLRRNLTPPAAASRINYTLDKFARNLERLARLDKLEGPNFNCFEAIGGVYTSLKKLYEHEKRAAIELLGASDGDGVKGGPGNKEHEADIEVMCKKSGRPRLNARGRIGLAIEYWTDGRYIAKDGPDPDAMDTDEGPSQELGDEGGDGIYSLLVDCSSPAKPYDPIRTSQNWISDAVEKTADVPNDLFGAQQTVIDWQDPPASYLQEAAEGQQPGSAAQGAGKLPDIGFVARLDPPIPLPATVVLLIRQLMLQGKADPNPQEHETWKYLSYDGLVLRPGQLDEAAEFKGMNEAASEHLRQTTSSHEVLVQTAHHGAAAPGSEAERTHHATLWSKPERGKLLEEVRFSHPRQITELLPTLRQYAFLNSILARSLGVPPPRHGNSSANGVAHEASAPPTLPALPLDVRLKTVAEGASNPHLEFTFPIPALPAAAGPMPPSPKASIAAHTTPAKPRRKLGPYSVSASDGHTNNSNISSDDLSLNDLLADDDGDGDGDDSLDADGAQDGSAGAEMLHVSLTIEPNGTVKLDAAEQNVLPALRRRAGGRGDAAATGDGERGDGGGESGRETKRAAAAATTTTGVPEKDGEDAKQDADADATSQEEQGGPRGTGEAEREQGAEDGMDGLAKEMTEQQERDEAEAEWQAEVQRLGRALEVCGDLGVWVEWVGQQARKNRQ